MSWFRNTDFLKIKNIYLNYSYLFFWFEKSEADGPPGDGLGGGPRAAHLHLSLLLSGYCCLSGGLLQTENQKFSFILQVLGFDSRRGEKFFFLTKYLTYH
jgi:hypothetical protein